jgi:hypothetical protein
VVNLTKDGYVAKTTSANKTIVGLLQNTWDPLYAAVFNHSSEISVATTNLTDGVLVKETASTSCAIAVTHSHSGVVTNFTVMGMREMMTTHNMPKACPFAGRDHGTLRMPASHAEWSRKR